MAKENIIYGVRPIIEALRESKQIEKLLVQKNISSESLRNIKEELRRSNQEVKIQYVPTEKLNALTHRENHQGFVAFVSLAQYSDFEQTVENIMNGEAKPFFVLLDHVTDVRNLGAIARTCECAGVSCLILPQDGSAAINEDAIKTSAGALLRIPVCRVKNVKTTLNYLKQYGIKVFAASEKAVDVYTEENLSEACVLVMGAEDKGVSKEALKMADNLIKIPILGKIESLNVSVAAGIIIYEILRQRQN